MSKTCPEQRLKPHVNYDLLPHLLPPGCAAAPGTRDHSLAACETASQLHRITDTVERSLYYRYSQAAVDIWGHTITCTQGSALEGLQEGLCGCICAGRRDRLTSGSRVRSGT